MKNRISRAAVLKLAIQRLDGIVDDIRNSKNFRNEAASIRAGLIEELGELERRRLCRAVPSDADIVALRAA